MLSKFGIKCQIVFGIIEKAWLEEQHLAALICLLEPLEKMTWYTDLYTKFSEEMGQI